MTAHAKARGNPKSIAIIVLAWLILQLGGLFTPGLLDDVDSIYIEIAREMLHRHDFVTPYIDGIRFFDKPPLMYWMASSSMAVFGESDWAARLPLALGVLALFLAVYALGKRIFASEHAGLYAALAMATSIGPYLYTRFFIPDILIALWMTLSVYFFLIALNRLSEHSAPNSALLPCFAFAATLALNLLTKGLIGIVFPIAFVLLYLALTRQLNLLPRLHLLPSALVFAAIALPWHILAALRNPAIAMPVGVELPSRAGWAWFYLYNEHVARFLGTRVPHDYGQTPRWLFWIYALLWIFPWAVFLPAALEFCVPRNRQSGPKAFVRRLTSNPNFPLVLWALLVLVFFTVSSRQEYYSIPALPALALLAGGFLARADRTRTNPGNNQGAHSIAPFAISGSTTESRAALFAHRWFLLPLASFIATICTFFAVTAPHPQPGTDLSALLSTNPELYNLSLGHIFDLTGTAMGLFRAPLAAVALGMVVLGPIAYLLRSKSRTYAANFAIAAGMTLVLLAAHQGLVRFNPILGSKGLADAILAEQRLHPQPGDLILLDGELTSGSTLLFYTRQPVHLVNGRVNGPWFGSFWPDAPDIFETDATLRRLWQGPTRIFLLTYNPTARSKDLAAYGPVRTLAHAGGKTILTSR
jgi:4-amino-4-deoxy-L-arabinose transferase-like glycosyltransferase